MNEEEKKSIEILKERKRDLLGLSNSSFYSCDRKLYKERVEAIDTILNLIEKQQKEIEDMVRGKFISKDKIREKIDLIDKEYAEIIEKNKNDLYLVNINAQRHSAMQSILEELLGE